MVRSTSIPYTINVRAQGRITLTVLATATRNVPYNQVLTADRRVVSLQLVIVSRHPAAGDRPFTDRSTFRHADDEWDV